MSKKRYVISKFDNRVYCEDCGEELIEEPIVKYDTQTGEQLSIKICGNLRCYSGCVDNGGHYFDFFGDCTMCGY